MPQLESPCHRRTENDDSPSDIIRTLETALKGTLWEPTAILEIRTQAYALALKLLGS